ncbi:MAG TPA: sulfatase [Candidatus Dormibacteraeota bacterium]|jgi:arylsulfatase A-like enzyme|nr:sulfatase [Candidatus Dormibacteraeota bacterium]
MDLLRPDASGGPVPLGGGGDRPNVILVLADSLRRDQLVAYGGPAETAPNLNRFAARSHLFRNHFVGSLPCMPARREIFSGRREFLWRPWGPLEPFDRRAPRLLAAAGYRTGIVTDHYHYWEEAANGYLQSFQSTELIRGHELDTWHPPLADDADLPSWVRNIERWRPGQGRRYYANVRDFRSEEDYFRARVMRSACRWLETYDGGAPFFLQVESFDVHEPFDVPEPYRSLYADPAARDRFTVWPPYQDVDRQAEFMARADPAELAFIRSQYRAKVTMVDRWLGELFRTLDERGLWDRTAVIVTTDHGHDLGERGVFGKQYPHFDSHACLPLMVWLPGMVERREVNSLTTTADLNATILDVAGVDADEVVWSRSLIPLIRGTGGALREALIYGTFGQGLCCTDGRWSLFKSPERDSPLFQYSAGLGQTGSPPAAGSLETGRFIPEVEVPQWRIPASSRPLSREDHLYRRLDDPGQERNLWGEGGPQRERMLRLARSVMDEEGFPEEQLRRLGLGR